MKFFKPPLKFRIVFEKRTMRIKHEHLVGFVTELLGEFGGSALLSETKVSISNADSVVEVHTENEKLVYGALVLCGAYKNIPCRFVCVP